MWFKSKELAFDKYLDEVEIRRQIRLKQDELEEKRELPTGITEFHAWSDRIIRGACLTATPESQKFALANLLINLSPTLAFETDIYFIHALRKTAVNQVADAIRSEIREAVKNRLAQEEQNKAAVTAPGDSNVLENKTV